MNIIVRMKEAPCQITDIGVTLVAQSPIKRSATQSVPRFIQEITDVYAREGETAVFECIYSGNPAPDVVWYKNDKLVSNTQNVKVRISDEEKKNIAND